jgi:LAO/AO transport system kinase
MQYLGKNRLSADTYIEGLLGGNTVILSKALSLIESRLEADQALSMKVLEGILANTGQSKRVGITGVPGVGKSTFIEVLGLYLVDSGHKVAVLTVDPSSQRTKGSILGDKTRMEQLSKSSSAFIRPSAAGKSLGGVAHHTRESILLCEAAGYDVVLVETVGVGQSETLVRDMVDYFLLLMIAGAGDELQGIKKGIIEMADALAITKADGENLKQAQQAQTVYANAMHLLTPVNSRWQPPILMCSAKKNQGIDKIWDSIKSYSDLMTENGYLEEQRREQRLKWMQECIRLGIDRYLEHKRDNSSAIDHLKQEVKEGKLLPPQAAAVILSELIWKKG